VRPRRGPRRPGYPAIALAILVSAVNAGSLNAASASISASVEVAAHEVMLALSSAEVRVGDIVRADATLTNLGSSRLTGISVELRVDPTGIKVRGDELLVVSRLQPRRTAMVSWKLCALQVGNYLVLVRATAGGVSVDSPARLLTVSGQRPRGCR
jgi:hypothetical protein